MNEFLFVLIGVVITLICVLLYVRFCTFRAQKPAEYDGLRPIMDIKDHLNGKIACEGVIYGPLGRVSSRFVAEFEAEWTGDSGVMREVFHYDSGSVQHREWRLQLDEGGVVRADADDLVGRGSGQQRGNALLLNYTIKLTPEAGGHALDVTDWMYLMQNGTIINRSQFRKFGIKVAELVATMRPIEVDAVRKRVA